MNQDAGKVGHQQLCSGRGSSWALWNWWSCDRATGTCGKQCFLLGSLWWAPVAQLKELVPNLGKMTAEPFIHWHTQSGLHLCPVLKLEFGGKSHPCDVDVSICPTECSWQSLSSLTPQIWIYLSQNPSLAYSTQFLNLSMSWRLDTQMVRPFAYEDFLALIPQFCKPIP